MPQQNTIQDISDHGDEDDAEEKNNISIAGTDYGLSSQNGIGDEMVSVFRRHLPDKAFGIENILQHPFPIVDAALLVFLEREHPKGTHIRREGQTSGSARYVLEYTDPQLALRVAIIDIRMVKENATYVEIALAKFAQVTPREQIFGYMEYFQAYLAQFMDELEQEQAEIAEVLETKRKRASKILPSPSEPILLDFLLAPLRTEELPPRRGGPFTWPEDDWAWEQVNISNRPRREVRSEWQMRLSQERPKLRDQNRSFRHAIDPRRKKEIPES